MVVIMITYIREDADNKLFELKEKNIPVYSVSRLETYNTCKYKYYKTYVMQSKEKSENIYSVLGSKVHSLLEKQFILKRNKSKEEIDFSKEILSELQNAELKGYSFSSEKVKEKWIYDIIHFCNNSKFYEMNIIENELHFVFDFDGLWLQGYIDAIVDNGDNTVSVIDWKTSSAFKASELDKKARQLMLYKIALEEAGTTVSHVYWDMLKYADISWVNKSKKISHRICERIEILDRMEGEFTKYLGELGYGATEIVSMFSLCRAMNTLDFFPDKLREKYVIGDYLLEYEIEKNKEFDFLSYIDETVDEIESNINNPQFWKPETIDEKNSFFCNMLCDVSRSCEAFKKYQEEFNSGNNIVNNGYQKLEDNFLKDLFG